MTSPSMSVDAKTPCGTIHITVAQGPPVTILLETAKNGRCLPTHLAAVQALLNLRSADGLALGPALLAIRGHNCDRAAFNAESRQIESCLTTVARKIEGLLETGS